MDLRILLVLCFGSLLLIGLPGCGEPADDDDTVGDDDDSAGDDDDSAGDDDDSAFDPVVDNDGDGHPSDTDCNDDDAAIHPGADELCDGTDRNCDGDSEQGAVDASVWYEDIDGDGYGVEANSQDSCNQPHGYSAYFGDCNDAEPSYHPGAAETDCTDPNDYNCDQSTGYADLDNDGVAACEDCNDDDSTINSAATEVCNTVDDDCDGLVDEAGADGGSSWYLDADGAGYGRATPVVVACVAPPSHVANDSDCDDLAPATYPGAAEVCDEVDNNCDAQVDEGAAAPSTWYADADGDGFGNAASSTIACAAPFGTVADATDCDDLDAASFPGGSEVCDGADNNCDSVIDEGVLGTFYADSDSDGYGDPGSPIASCFLPSGASPNDQDCDDGQSAVHPGGIEVCDSLDNNCDTLVDNGSIDADTWYIDYDGDGFGGAGSGVVSCSAIGGSASNDQDCDDDDGDNYPGNSEVCDAADNNCNSIADEDFDLDADGFNSCGADGLLGNADDDCNDLAPGVFPGAPQACDGSDADCDGAVDNDADLDGFSATSCGGDDCNDSDGSIFPDSSGVCVAGSNCAALLAANPSSGDGQYTIDKDGPSGPAGPIDVYCDMTTDSGGWSLVWKHAYYEVGNATDDMRFYSSTRTACTDLAAGFCNEPSKGDFSPSEMRIHATHNGTTVYDYKGNYSSNMDVDWTGAILTSAVQLTDLCTSGNGIFPEPENGGHAYLGVTFDKANQGDYISNCDTDRYGPQGSDLGSDCRWENCPLPSSISSSPAHTQMTVLLWVR